MSSAGLIALRPTLCLELQPASAWPPKHTPVPNQECYFRCHSDGFLRHKRNNEVKKGVFFFFPFPHYRKLQTLELMPKTEKWTELSKTRLENLRKWKIRTYSLRVPHLAESKHTSGPPLPPQPLWEARAGAGRPFHSQAGAGAACRAGAARCQGPVGCGLQAGTGTWGLLLPPAQLQRPRWWG